MERSTYMTLGKNTADRHPSYASSNAGILSWFQHQGAMVSIIARRKRRNDRWEHRPREDCRGRCSISL